MFALCLLPILATVFAIGTHTPFWADSRPLFAALGVATLAWWMAIALARQRCGDLRLILVGAIALRLVGLIGWADLSRDAHQDLFEGRVVASGASPYALAPDAPELESLREEWPELYAAYGAQLSSPAPLPLGQLAVTAVVVASDVLAGEQPKSAAVPSGLGALRLFVTLCDLLLLWPLVVLLRRRGAPTQLAVAWAWSPAVVIEFAGSGHLDGLALLLLISSLALLVAGKTRGGSRRRRGTFGIVLLAGATLVRPLALCALPFVVRGRGAWKRVGLFVLLTSLALVPLVFLRGGLAGFERWLGSLVFESAHGAIAYPWIEWVFARLFEADGSFSDPARLARMTLFGLWIVVGLRLFALRRGPLAATSAMIGAFLLLTPALHPWTVLWILPFVALEPRASWLWLVGAAPLLYAPLADYRGHGGWTERPEFFVFGVVPFLALFAYEARLAARNDGSLRTARRHMRLRRLRTT